MEPVVFDQCFGWLHTPTDESGDVAVIICSGLRQDGDSGYRSFRLLADALADVGYPALRFDYPGTGNSREIDSTEHWIEWQQSIQLATDWLREKGLRRFVYCGLRIGATLAAVVAEQRTDVVGLVLIEPALRGRSYIRELITELKLIGDDPDTTNGIAIRDFRLSNSTIQQIAEIDLRKLVLRRDCQVVVYTQMASPILSDCINIWSKGGTKVTCQDFKGMEAMLRIATLSHEPPANIGRIVSWMRKAIPTESAVHLAPLPNQIEIRHGSCTEMPLRFGPSNNLFGVLCRPTELDQSSQVVLLLNCGGSPHQGLYRLNVDLARKLANEGFASLRMDFPGIGDSIASGDAETHVFETKRNEDISAAIDALEHLGFQKFAVQGVCSGAYHAFYGALSEWRINVAIMINLPTFQWRNVNDVEFLSNMQKNPVSLLIQLRKIEIWRRLLRQGLSGLQSRITMQYVWFKRWMTYIARRYFGAAPSFVEYCTAGLAQRVKSLYIFSEGDPGVDMLNQELGLKRSPPGAVVSIISGLDHALTTPDMRTIACQHIVSILTEDNYSPRAGPMPLGSFG